MDTSNIVALILGSIGFIISITGFIITPILNLKSKKLEKRLEYRFILFQKIVELWEFTNKLSAENDIKGLMSEVNKLIQLYGYANEITLFNEVVVSYNNCAQSQTETSRQQLKDKFSLFFLTLFNTYRKEIVLDQLPRTESSNHH
ncbi:MULTISPECIES: hypothetical protein [Flavobacterium]|nr:MULTISPECIES: hypothetical protein [Flavobacterium]ABQ06648.1 hypothetical protein Fjoh_3634 [Flavobacterium johnsoniae UW101]WQG82403.1 hypothetical protein SR927_04645 [Flavobacterium johnsoniae UW101]SHM00171.1 hypothetical protein SAMN05444146_5139 [Flavobacterium johnsoniae]